jgi:hypothetical protein
MTAVGWGGQYDIALDLLKAGADPKIFQPMSNSKLAHIVAGDEQSRSAIWTAKQKSDFDTLVEWLAEHGESLQQAKADRERWKSWSQTTGEYRRKMDAEIAERKAREAREARERAAAQKNPEREAK